jgi:hypothetical protein
MARKKTRTPKRRNGRFVKAASPKRRRAAPKRRRAVAAAPKRRIAARRRASRRNPRSVFSSAAVELGLSALAGVALGTAADSMPRWSWMPEQLQAGHVVGAVLLIGGWKLAKGHWRQRLIAAGIGSAGQSIARETVAPALAGVLGGAADDGSNAFPRSANVRYLRPGAPRMQAQSAALAANGLIR